MWKLIISLVVLAIPVCYVTGIETSEVTIVLTALFDGLIYCWLAPRS